ncbi:MAG TPA: hypothetical protein VMT88_03190 [Actinomycetes bacterium]|nr:hypothetical protein [Actinomycetes bacterium]
MTTQTLPELRPDPFREQAPPRQPPWRAILIVIAVLLVVAGVATRIWWPDGRVDVRAGTTLVSADGLAARYGIDITLIGVTANGGMIDFRYQVVDPDKANSVIHDLDLFPKIVAEDTGATLAMRTLPHNHSTTLKLGGNYFFLIPNARNALHAGSKVTLVIGDVRLEHVVVQG